MPSLVRALNCCHWYLKSCSCADFIWPSNKWVSIPIPLDNRRTLKGRSKLNSKNGIGNLHSDPNQLASADKTSFDHGLGAPYGYLVENIGDFYLKWGNRATISQMSSWWGNVLLTVPILGLDIFNNIGETLIFFTFEDLVHILIVGFSQNDG